MRKINIEDGSRDDYLDQILINSELVEQLNQKDEELRIVRNEMFGYMDEIAWLKSAIRDLKDCGFR